MDQLTAYRILQLEPGSTVEEIKSAYAKLSKEFHPEEHPEEFQKIHEAYTTLARGARRGRPQSAPNEQRVPEPARQTEPTGQTEPVRQPEESGPTYDFSQIPKEVKQPQEPNQPERPVPPNQPEYGFDRALERAQEQERSDLHQLTLRALAEVEILLSPQYRNKLKLFRCFFGKEQYQGALKGAEFMHYFSQMLAGTKLKKPVYDFFIDYYRLRGLNPQALIPEAAELYHVLDAKCGMHGKARKNIPYFIPVGVIAGLRAGIRNGAEMSAKVFGVLFVCVIVVTLMIWTYRKLYENHSSIFAQSMLAGFLLISQLIFMFTDFYGPVFGTDGGILVAFFLFLVAGIWLIVLGIAAIAGKIKERSGRHN